MRLLLLLAVATATASAAPADEDRLPDGGFLENATPFLRSALVFRDGDEENTTRRGVLVPLGHKYWGCFDTDLLRWAAIWKAPPGEPPLTYDSMAAASFPNKRAKSEKPPYVRGEVQIKTPELPGVTPGARPGPDPRKNVLVGSNKPVGPLPVTFGRWMGLSLRGTTPVLHYRVGNTLVSETISASAGGNVERLLEVYPGPQSLSFRLGSPGWKVLGEGARINSETLELQGSTNTRVILLTDAPTVPDEVPQFPETRSATPGITDSFSLASPAPVSDGPFSVRSLARPEGSRAVRPTDLAFLSDGTCLMATFDGDIWRIEGLEEPTATWTRVATGIFEPMGIATTSDDRVFVLGRDQITELVDTNGDGTIDLFRNASDAFLQTLQTRDYATSLDILPDGSFIIAKGGIHNMGQRHNAEVSRHRGTVLKISPDGNSAQVLADGLRLPFAGVRADGEVFASDQQGHFIPSTPIHHLTGTPPFLGFQATNHRREKEATNPLFYHPYQHNRSGAGFVNLGEKAFSDLAHAFLHVSWNGRLFGIATPEAGLPFSWQLPIQFDFPTLKGAIHPASGKLYLIGLGISGYNPSTPMHIGFASVEQSHPLPTPAALDIQNDRIAITFNRPLAGDETVVPAHPTLRLFDLKRTEDYGSGHFRWDGEPGEHHLQARNVSLSSDRRTLTLEFDLVRASDVLDLQLTVNSGNVMTPLHLYAPTSHLDPASKRELAALKKESSEQQLRPADPTRGEATFAKFACAGCHSMTGEKLTGPPLNGIASRQDESFLRESILDPTAQVAEGFLPAMPSFKGVIPEQDFEDLIAYLKTLK